MEALSTRKENWRSILLLRGKNVRKSERREQEEGVPLAARGKEGGVGSFSAKAEEKKPNPEPRPTWGGKTNPPPQKLSNVRSGRRPRRQTFLHNIRSQEPNRQKKKEKKKTEKRKCSSLPDISEKGRRRRNYPYLKRAEEIQTVEAQKGEGKEEKLICILQGGGH